MIIMRNQYLLLLVLSLTGLLSLTMVNASFKVYYKTSGATVVWYYPQTLNPSNMPVGYTNQPIYVADISQLRQHDTFLLQLRPYNMTTFTITENTPYYNISTFTANSSQFTIPASYVKAPGSYRIVDTGTNVGENVSVFILLNQSIVPAQLSQSNQNLPIWIVITVMAILIIILFVLVLRKSL